MRLMQRFTIVLACLTAAAVWGCSAADELAAKAPPKPRADEVRTVYTAAQIAKWETHAVDAQTCVVSPAINFGKDIELNHHRITVTYVGGSVEMSLAHSTSNKLASAIEKKHLPRLYRHWHL